MPITITVSVFSGAREEVGWNKLAVRVLIKVRRKKKKKKKKKKRGKVVGIIVSLTPSEGSWTLSAWRLFQFLGVLKKNAELLSSVLLFFSPAPY